MADEPLAGQLDAVCGSHSAIRTRRGRIIGALSPTHATIDGTSARELVDAGEVNAHAAGVSAVGYSHPLLARA